MVDEHIRRDLRPYDLSGKVIYDYDEAKDGSSGLSGILKGFQVHGDGFRRTHVSVRRVGHDLSARALFEVLYLASSSGGVLTWNLMTAD